MTVFLISSSLVVGMGMGWVTSFILHIWRKKQRIHQIQQEAKNILKSAREKESFNREDIVHKVEEEHLVLRKKQEKDLEPLREHYRTLKMEVDRITHQKRSHLKKQENIKNKKAIELKNLTNMTNQMRVSFEGLNSKVKDQTRLYFQHLKDMFQTDLDSLKGNLKEGHLAQCKTRIEGLLQKEAEHFQHNLNKKAHFILELALNRFRKPYCSERGIKSVTFASQKTMQEVLGPDFSKMKILEQECGVDMKVNENEASVSILGIDPVRRELGRMTLHRVSKKRRVFERDLKRMVQENKRELFRRIVRDGNRIGSDLKLQNIKPEVKNMMGALRYRYSFAQNQHFHCEEVGWLAGLLQSEIEKSSSTTILTARRAGMMHDIGKAMDYSKEGGHAVIGADFIEQHGESPEVVHAVRAHHYDTSPENILDFLVIAADALSGARPGARRSTEDSYNQKVLTLEKIGKSFKGVKDTYIMSAGREIRVIVDSKKISDTQAVSLSKQIAGKIEEECSYPGLIKVTVVRTVTQNVEVSPHIRSA